MSAVAIAGRLLRVYVGDDEQDWSASALGFVPGRDSLPENGIVQYTGNLAIQGDHLNPESLDPRRNPSRWRPGQPVRVAIPNSAGALITLGTFRILRTPASPPRDAPVLDLELGCWLAWATTLERETDRSGVTIGANTNSAIVARRLLEAAGVPAEAIDLGVWPYELGYPLQNEAGDSLVARAGELAYANDHRYLYQDWAGVIRAGVWDGSSGSPIAVISLGSNEIEFEAEPDPVEPVEEIEVVGQGFELVTTPEEYSSSFTVFEPASNYSDDAFGTVALTTTNINQWGTPTVETPYYWTHTEIRRTQPQAAVFIGEGSVSSTLINQHEQKRYHPTTKLLYYIDGGEIADIRAIVDGALVSAWGRTYTRRAITELTIDPDKEVVIGRQLRETVPRITLVGTPGSSNFTPTLDREQITGWTEDKPDWWTERTSERQAAGQSGGRGGNVKPTAMLSKRPEIKENSPPPAAERWPEPTSLKEHHYKATALWQHPGGPTGRVRPRVHESKPAFSNAQCFNLACAIVKILQGRADCHTVEMPLVDALIQAPPLALVQVDDGETLWTFCADALTYELQPTLAKVGFLGIAVARTASPLAASNPYADPLPDYDNGLVPDQSPLPDPAPFVPPTNEGVALVGYDGVALADYGGQLVTEYQPEEPLIV